MFKHAPGMYRRVDRTWPTRRKGRARVNTDKVDPNSLSDKLHKLCIIQTNTTKSKSAFACDQACLLCRSQLRADKSQQSFGSACVGNVSLYARYLPARKLLAEPKQQSPACFRCGAHFRHVAKLIMCNSCTMVRKRHRRKSMKIPLLSTSFT
eukprot:6194292-Pleurochrysis_carterae.AAC.2